MLIAGRRVGLIAVLGLLGNVASLSQEVTDPKVGTPATSEETPKSTGVQLEEITITATRRDTNLQSVPGTVEAFPAEALRALEITSADKLTTVTPGLTAFISGGNNLYIRGIGSSSTGYNEAQVAVYVDGLYLPNPAMSIYSFNNIEQVEVLKGPQGTLYGRNATAGLISVTTRDPDGAPRFDASVGYGNFNTTTLNFYGSIPITDTLGVNASVYHSKQSDGWSENTFLGTQQQRSNETGFQSKLVWRPTSETKVTGSFIYDYNNRDIGYSYEELPGTVGADGTKFLGQYRTASRIDPSAPFTSYTGSITVEQDIGFANLKSISGYQDSHQVVTFSAAAGPGLPLPGQGSAVNILLEHDLTFSQEFQVSSQPSDSRLNWIVGAFLYHDNTQIDLQTYTTCLGAVCTPRFIPTSIDGFPTTRSYSGYGDATYRFFDATRLTLGMRYTDETKGLSGLVTPLPGYPNSVTTLPPTTITYPGQPYPGNPNGIPTSLHFDKVTYRIVLAQDFAENIHGYVSDNLGFKSGAYNANVFVNPPALPETLQAYEIGLKTEFFNRRLRLNTSYFYYNYDNVQLRSSAPPAPPGNALLENAAKEHQRGADIDFNIIVTNDISLNGGVEFLDSKYINYPGTTCTTPATKVVNGVTVGVPLVVPCNLAGYNTLDAPPVSGFVGLVYSIDSSFGSWSLTANDHFNSRYSLATDSSMHQAPHQVVDASLMLTSHKHDWDIQLFGQNLTGEYYYITALNAIANNYLVVPGAPRTYGVTVGYHYH